MWILLCFLLLYAVWLVLRTRTLVHMLQLNSYQIGAFFRWYTHDPRKMLVYISWSIGFCGLLFIAQPLFQTAHPVLAWIFAIAMTAFGLFGALPKKAKKPLVYTWRVRRLLITIGVLHLLWLAWSLWWANAYAPFLFFPTAAEFVMLPLSLGIALLPLFIALAALINIPIEAAIARHFVKDAAARLHERPDLTVIGITGSYGKTSTKTFLHALLSVQYNVLMTPESYNTTMGVVRTIRERLLPTHEVFIAEMGAKGVGEIKEICDLVHPQYGILTSIGEQHLESFGNLQNIIQTKFELADAIPADGFICLNMDNPYIAAHPVANTRVVTYGAAADSTADYRATDISVARDGSRFTMLAPGGEQCRFTTRLLGAHNIQNLAGCIALAHTFGIPLKKLVYPVELLRPVPHRLELLPNGFIDDAYNSNPAGFRSALDTLRGFEGQRVLVTPGMVELGQCQDALNKELGAYAADCCDYAVLVGKRQAPPLFQGLCDADFPRERIYIADTLQEALRFVASLPAEGPRTVLLENDLPDNYA